jgi:hypothetical protein
MLDFAANAINVPVEHSTRENIRGEVAVGTLGLAKRNRNVQSEWHLHLYDNPTAGLTEAGTYKCYLAS